MNPYRKRRIQLFESLVSRLNAEPIRILDVGGEVAFWKDTDFWDNPKYQITVSNIGREEDERAYLARHGPSNMDWLYADATDLGPALERGFDVLFSNSVIEHVGGWAEMARMAAAIEGFGGPYFVQTPNLWFPIEPHFRTPFFGILPYALRVLLVRCFNLGCYRRARTWEEAREKVNTTRLLSVREMRRLFPKATVEREKVFGLTKSIYVHTFPER